MKVSVLVVVESHWNQIERVEEIGKWCCESGGVG